MSDETIEIFARVRPVPRPSTLFKCFATSDESRLEFTRPRDSSDGYINNQREHYEFKFSGVFDMQTRQEEVFDVVAKRACLNALDGYNSTIFAYGQTGSGKTFTITGGPEKYSDRGIIPRSLSFLFDECRKRSDMQFSVYISYLEVYNNTGYDLLDPQHESEKIEDLPKVSLLEDMDGNLHLRNLSAHMATSEEEALNLLFLGDTNRMISETPMNLVSSRSHCVFTVSIEARQTGSDIVRRSKLHLVDLAGSERVAKSNVDGQTLTEAKYINTSLHFLEQVIVALSDRSKGKKDVYIPYRNSILTSVLRDSLGGNSKTVMIATVSPDQDHVEESISTCRFAMRVASIKQKAVLNEELDPKLVISRLKKTISELKEEVHYWKSKSGETDDDRMLDADRRKCADMCASYVDDPSPDASLTVGRMAWIQECFKVLKGLVLSARSSGGGGGGGGGGRSSAAADDRRANAPSASSTSPVKRKDPASMSTEGAPSSSSGDALNGLQSEVVQEQLKRMQLQVAQRDNEINILVGMLKKKGAKMTVSEACTQTDGGTSLTASASTSFLSSLPASTPSGSHAAGPSSKLHGSASSSALTQSSASSAPVRQSSELPPSQAPLMVLNDPNLLADRNRYFEHFRKSYRKNEVIEENKLLLKERYDEAQTVGKTVNDSRAKINALKAQIEQLRVERAMQGLDQNGQISEEERQMVTAMESEKQRYKENYNRLRDLKSEIEGIQRMLEKSKVQLQKDFEQWYLVMLQQQGLQINKENQNASMTSSASTALSTGTTAPSTNYSSVNASTSSVATSAAVDGKVKYAWGVSTGDAEADADIAAFYAAKESILQQRLQPGAPR